MLHTFTIEETYVSTKPYLKCMYTQVRYIRMVFSYPNHVISLNYLKTRTAMHCLLLMTIRKLIYYTCMVLVIAIMIYAIFYPPGWGKSFISRTCRLQYNKKTHCRSSSLYEMMQTLIRVEATF